MLQIHDPRPDPGRSPESRTSPPDRAPPPGPDTGRRRQVKPACKRQVFDYLVAIQDTGTVPVFASYRLTAKRFGLSEREVWRIADVGLRLGWLDED